MSRTGSTTLTGSIGPASPLPSPKREIGGSHGLPRQIRADCRFYLALRHPKGCGALRSLLTCLLSRGLFLLAAHRLSHYYYALRPRQRRSPATIALRILIFVGRTFAIILAKSDIYHATVVDGGVHLSDDGQLTIGARRIASPSGSRRAQASTLRCRPWVKISGSAPTVSFMATSRSGTERRYFPKQCSR